MHDADRFKLLFGPYPMPRCRVGRTWLRCAIRGKVKVVGISDTPVPWPVCKSNRHRVPIICGGLPVDEVGRLFLDGPTSSGG